MLGSRVHQAGMDAGERWTLLDVVGQPIYGWDSRGHRTRNTFDALRRPSDFFVRDADGGERLVGRTVYGESEPVPEARNLRGRIARILDAAGIVTHERYDFKGNLLASRRQFVKDYASPIDWEGAPEVESETFATTTTYDAQNRPVSVTTPDGSVLRPTFNEGSLLQAVDVELRGAATPTAFVSDIDYDARGRRTRIAYGNGIETTLEYDATTARLTRLVTSRGADRLQELAYTYDPAGHIVHVADDAQQTIYFANQVVAPHNDYTYDATYRLVGAEGREHIGQVSQPQSTWDDTFRVQLPHPGDGQRMRRYVERYEYDAVGNLLSLAHRAAQGDWTSRNSTHTTRMRTC
jgi:YD repeat-containing protein